MDFHEHLPTLRFEFFYLLNPNLHHRSLQCSHVQCFPPQERRMFFPVGGSGAPGPAYKCRTLLVSVPITRIVILHT